MSLVQIHGENDVRIDTVPRPSAGPNDVLIAVQACGICGSDLGYIAMGGLTPPGEPMPLGHELSGRVEAVGEHVRGIRVGQFVVVNPMANGGAIGNGGPEGGFAPWLLVRDVASAPEAVLALPPELDAEYGALVEPLAVAMHAVNRAGVKPGEKAVVVGAGPIGLCAVAVLKHFGVADVVVADRSRSRLDVARELGAAHTICVAQEDLDARLRELHGVVDLMGVAMPATHRYIEATGVGAVLENLVATAGPGATIAVVGVHKQAISLDPVQLLLKELTLVGSMAYPDEFPAVIDMLRQGDVDVRTLISHRFSLSEFAAALDVARDPERAIKVMIDRFD
jgi:2-desacetyl-2-hydroxyethyl bacteriochlorophyllide A dehydrogenase